MPDDIVKRYKGIFEAHFQPPDFEYKDKTIEVFSEAEKKKLEKKYGIKLHGREIIISCNSPHEPKVPAATICHKSNGSLIPVIHLNLEFENLPIEKQKSYLGHEWIHSMLILEGRQTNNRVSEKMDLFLLLTVYGDLGCIWHEPEEEQAIDQALEKLFVSKEALHNFLPAHFSINLSEIKVIAKENPSKIDLTLIAEKYSKTYHVNLKICRKRIISELWRID